MAEAELGVLTEEVPTVGGKLPWLPKAQMMQDLKFDSASAA